MDQKEIKKVVVIGPESTGKSTLCTLLAQYYKTQCCPEFAREYLLQYGTNYSFDDLLIIAKGQLDLEEKYSESVSNQSQMMDDKINTSHSTLHMPILFIDTDMYVMKVWCEYVFGKCHQFILDEIVKRKYDLYLLCNIDLPWVKDELREYPNEQPRKELHKIYKDLLINQTTPWVEISGNYEERLQKAIEAINNIIL
ncbi:MAG: AAA family ATPase [Bacteroidetes bacterium]|nr:AAA family ATPase [Bacteroidota bacterium]MBS1648330.1 AAA family ATPase [Bacteroidota bacterium]